MTSKLTYEAPRTPITNQGYNNIGVLLTKLRNTIVYNTKTYMLTCPTP